MDVTLPKRYTRDKPKSFVVKKSILSICTAPVKKLKGKDKKNLVARTPKPHDRSIKPCDISAFLEKCKRRNTEVSLCHEYDEFFDGVVGGSMHSTTRATLCRRMPPVSSMSLHEGPDEVDGPTNSSGCLCRKKQVAPQSSRYMPEKVWTHRSRTNQTIPNQTRSANEARSNEGGLDNDGQGTEDATDGETPNEDGTGNDEATDMPDGRMDEFKELLVNIVDNSDRVSVGMKLTRKLFGFGPSKEASYSRPLFTVWITIIQAIIYFIMIGSYGVAPIGIGVTEEQKDVLMTDLNVRSMSKYELQNLWIGPRQEDLIHLGAKFSPCIKKDLNIVALINSYKQSESHTGCCVNNDGSGCVQSSNGDCSPLLSTWMNHTVCGEDPKYCQNPPALPAHVTWSDDITNWPICTATNNASTPDYQMMCPVVGRPCCIGVLGECVMATREYCDFRNGYFHDEAFLCSQVSCIGEVCGMLPFSDPAIPDQFYRFIASQFVHPGLLSLIITQIFQWLIQYDLERLTGSIEMAVVYIGCGICGSLMSAIFIPYYVEAGPSGSQFGVLAILTIEILRWNISERPKLQMLIIVVCLVILFFIGLVVPAIDNWSHLAGYAVGIFLALGFRPILSIRGIPLHRYVAIVQVLVSFLSAVVSFVILMIVFYLWEYVECDKCLYFNCIPFTENYCEGMSINVTKNSALVA